jgi:hypothetical protein
LGKLGESLGKPIQIALRGRIIHKITDAAATKTVVGLLHQRHSQPANRAKT